MEYTEALNFLIKGFSVMLVFGVPLAALRMWLHRPVRGQVGDTKVAARLERIELAIDTIAVEMERLSEGQRFTTKLLSQSPSAQSDRGAVAHSDRQVS